jgi:hypothetical protein
MHRLDLDLFKDFFPILRSLKVHLVSAHAFGGQTKASGATQPIHHGEDLIPRGIRTTIEKLFQRKTGLLGKHPEYSLSEIALSNYLSHGHTPFLC